ncbi:MAG: hypothetical protein ACK4J0_00485 [Candidatus Anstonellaceae archaeon]
MLKELMNNNNNKQQKLEKVKIIHQLRNEFMVLNLLAFVVDENDKETYFFTKKMENKIKYIKDQIRDQKDVERIKKRNEILQEIENLKTKYLELKKITKNDEKEIGELLDKINETIKKIEEIVWYLY